MLITAGYIYDKDIYCNQGFKINNITIVLKPLNLKFSDGSRSKFFEPGQVIFLLLQPGQAK